MALSVRRVITGHDSDGKAVVNIDEVVTSPGGSRPGISSKVLWTTDRSPADNNSDEDMSQRPVNASVPSGSTLRVIEYLPGVSPRNHRTRTVDYVIVISGEIDMQMDDTKVHLNAGDVLVQRGTIHNWENRSTEPCVIAFVLIDAEPVAADGNELEIVG